jgi:protein-disulfide isomerase
MRRDAAGRTPPPVRSKGAPGARQASPRVLAIAAFVVVMIAVGVGLGVAFGTSSGGNNSTLPQGTPTTGSSTGPAALSGSKEVANLFKGIPQHGLVLGSPFAPAQLTEFIDLQCPVCKDFETTQLPTLVKKYVRTGKLSIKMMPWAIIGPDSLRGQNATIAATLQSKGFQFAEMLYVNQATENTGWLNNAMVAQAAASVDGMHVPQLVADENSSNVQQIVKLVDNYASAHGFNATPTILLAKKGKKPQVVSQGLPTLSTLESQIQAAAGG